MGGYGVSFFSLVACWSFRWSLSARENVANRADAVQVLRFPRPTFCVLNPARVILGAPAAQTRAQRVRGDTEDCG